MIVDELLRKRHEEGKPIQIGLVGAGAAARMVAFHLAKPVEGMRLAAIANRTPARAAQLCKELGVAAVDGNNKGALDGAIARGALAVSDNAKLLCESKMIDVIVDATGAVEFGADLCLSAIEHGKHAVFLNTELDSTLGPILKAKADAAGVTVTNTDGDEPGVAMNLVRYVKSIGLKPVAAGNIKGMVDLYRNPDTQRDFAAKYSMNPRIVTSFADGTKLCMESAVIANATGFKVGKRGMYGHRCDHVNDVIKNLPMNQLLDGGLVDYALGAAPHTGAFVVVHEEHPVRKSHLGYFKMGEGPLYVFYTPYHLPHLQIASTIGRAVLLGDATIAPIAGPVCSVATVAKKDLGAGDVLDGVGGFASYGVIENTGTFEAEDLLPMGLSLGGKLRRDIRKDEPIKFSDVELPAGRLCDRLYAEQKRQFSEAGARRLDRS